MRRRQIKENRRRTACILEILDDRTLLSVAPAASPFSAALVARYEAGVERLAEKYTVGAERLDKQVASRLAQLDQKLVTAANRDQAKIAKATTGTAAGRRGHCIQT